MSNDDLSDIAGLPSELGIDEELEKDALALSVRKETRRYGKAVTIVEGFGSGAVDVDEIASDLKSQLATGGTVQDDGIELQGDHEDGVREILRDRGFHLE